MSKVKVIIVSSTNEVGNQYLGGISEDEDEDEVLGDTEKPLAKHGAESFSLQITDLLDALVNPISSKITKPSELTLEISGSVEIKGEAKAPLIVFNVGGSVSKSNTLKILLKTTLDPKQARGSSGQWGTLG